MPIPATTTLALGVQILGEAIQLTPISPAQAILKISGSILKIIDADRSDDGDMQRLAEQVLSIAVAYSDGMKLLHDVGDNTSDLKSLSDKLFRCLEGISQVLQTTSKKGVFTRALGRSATARKLSLCESELSHIATQMETRIMLRNKKLSQAILEPNAEEMKTAIEATVAQCHEESIQLIKSEVLKESHRKLQRSSFGHAPPTASSIFFGRSEYVDRLVTSLVNVPTYHAILGPGGIGKTSLALNVLHDPRIIAVYGKHRYFLACETTTNASGIIAGLADIFNLEEKSFMTSFKRVCQMIGSEILFLLDNFETPWENAEKRSKVEDFLSQLSSIPNVSMVITLRGAERPYGVPWSRPFLPILEPLDFDAARQTFVSISDVSCDNDDMARLLEEVDCFPLAITLLAAQAQYVSCASLLEQWHTSKTSMVTRGWDSRLSSLDVSISMSLESTRFTSNPLALSLMQILSLLPDGATFEELNAMTADDFDVHKTLATVLQVALAYNGAHSRIRALVPIREYIRSKHPIPQPILKHLLDYHATLSSYASSSAYTTDDMTMLDRLCPCINNIHSVIRACFGADPLAERGIEAAISVTSFHHHSHAGAISILLEEASALARASQKPLLQAKCLRRLCMSQSSPLEIDHAKGYILEAVNILRTLGSPESSEELVNTLPELANIVSNSGQYKKAIPIAREAVSLITERTRPISCANAFMMLGTCLAKTGDFAEATKAIKSGGSSFDADVYPALALKYSQHLCDMYWRRDMPSQIIHVADTCLNLEVVRSQRHWRAGMILGHRGVAYMALARYEAARNDFRESIQWLAASAKELHIAQILKNLGFTYIACGDFEAAFTTLRAGLEFDGSPNYLGPDLAMAILELQQGRFGDALIYCDRGLTAEDHVRLPMVSWRRLQVLQVRCQAQIRSGAEDAMSSCILAAITAHKMVDLSAISIGILCLGDAFFFLEKDAATASACYFAFLDLVRYTGLRRCVANALMRLGVTDYLLGDSARAARRLGQAIRFYRETEGDLWAEYCLDRLRFIELGGIETQNIPFFPPICCMNF